MKKWIVTIIFILTGVYCVHAQDTISRYKFGIECYYGRTTISEQCVFPTLTFGNTRQTFFAGPALYYLAHKFPTPIGGAQLGYRFFPNRNTQRFNLYFEYNLNYLNGTVTEDPVTNGYEYRWLHKPISKIAIKKVSCSNYLGFGFRLNLVKRLYINTGVGIGILTIYKENYTYYYKDGTIDGAMGRLDLRHIGLNRLFKLGFGWNLFTM